MTPHTFDIVARVVLAGSVALLTFGYSVPQGIRSGRPHMVIGQSAVFVVCAVQQVIGGWPMLVVLGAAVAVNVVWVLRAEKQLLRRQLTEIQADFDRDLARLDAEFAARPTELATPGNGDESS